MVRMRHAPKVNREPCLKVGVGLVYLTRLTVDRHELFGESPPGSRLKPGPNTSASLQDEDRWLLKVFVLGVY